MVWFLSATKVLFFCLTGFAEGSALNLWVITLGSIPSMLVWVHMKMSLCLVRSFCKQSFNSFESYYLTWITHYGLSGSMFNSFKSSMDLVCFSQASSLSSRSSMVRTSFYPLPLRDVV